MNALKSFTNGFRTTVQSNNKTYGTVVYHNRTKKSVATKRLIGRFVDSWLDERLENLPEPELCGTPAPLRLFNKFDVLTPPDWNVGLDEPPKPVRRFSSASSEGKYRRAKEQIREAAEAYYQTSQTNTGKQVEDVAVGESEHPDLITTATSTQTPFGVDSGSDGDAIFTTLKDKVEKVGRSGCWNPVVHLKADKELTYFLKLKYFMRERTPVLVNSMVTDCRMYFRDQATNLSHETQYDKATRSIAAAMIVDSREVGLRAILRTRGNYLAMDKIAQFHTGNLGGGVGTFLTRWRRSKIKTNRIGPWNAVHQAV